ncbi:hypothetical protein M758_6G096800 [Ceratodon purpureus]|nr:hypothetical protein M758_6G096800 [Ceratodon purpureus]
MEGSGPSDEGSREVGVEVVGEGSTRWRGSRLRKPRNGLASWTERTFPSRNQSSNEAEAEETGVLRDQDIDTVDGGGRWRRLTNAEAEADLSVLRNMAEPRDGTDSRDNGTEDGTEVMEVTGWRNPRVVRRNAARVRSERVARSSAALPESSEGPELRHFGDLLDGRARGTEASGSRDVEVHDYSAVFGLSSDEEDGPASGKKPAHEVIDLGGDSPQLINGRVNGLISDDMIRNEEAGPSQSSGQSPLRRLMQRPASADAKRARRVLRSGVALPEERDDDDEFLTANYLEDVNDPIWNQIPVAQSRPEPHNLRRGGSTNMAALRRERSSMAAPGPRSRLDGRPFTSNGSRGRLGRHRFQPGGSSGVGLSDLNHLRMPFSVPSSSGNDSADAQSNGVVNLDEPDSPTLVSMRPGNTIVLEDDGESDRARQLAEDERVARELQDSFAREDLGIGRPSRDEYLARLLQAQENSHGRGLPIEQRPVFFAPSGMRALLGGDDDEREALRLFRNELAQGHVPDNAASSSRIVRRAYGRNNALGRSLNSQSAPTRDIMNTPRHFQFPASMGLDRRMDVLAALEMAFQDQVPVGFQLAHVDRDFNENDYEMLLALDTDNDRHRGASWESISQLPVTTLAPTDVTDEDCSICLDTPVAGDVVRRLPCMHVFHQPCIDQWLQCQAVCPVCKAHI